MRPELLAQLDVAVGDDVIVGDARFTIRGVVLAEPGRRAGAFSFGTRVFVDLEDLKTSGLLRFGSRATHRMLVKMPGRDTERLARDLRQAFRGRFVSVRTSRSAEDEVGRELGRAENYLSLVGLIIVLLGGVGVWSVIRVFVQQKLRSVAVLKCVGGSTRQVLTVYVAQVVLMGLTGSAIGVILAAGAVAWLRPAVAAATGVEAGAGLTASAVAQGAGIGLLVALLFALVPLLDVRHVRPSILLRASEAPRPRRDAVWFGTTFVIGALLVAMAAWQAGSWRVGLILATGFAGVSAVLVGAGILLLPADAGPGSGAIASPSATLRAGSDGPGTRFGRCCWPWDLEPSSWSACACSRRTCCGRWQSACGRTRRTCSLSMSSGTKPTAFARFSAGPARRARRR